MHRAPILRISEDVNGDGHPIKVKIFLGNGRGEFRPGMYLGIRLSLTTKDPVKRKPDLDLATNGEPMLSSIIVSVWMGSDGTFSGPERLQDGKENLWGVSLPASNNDPLADCS